MKDFILDAIGQMAENGLMPHGLCLLVEPDLIITFLINNFIIALTYIILIPSELFLYWKRSHGTKVLFHLWNSTTFAVSFSFFIAMCGIGHLINNVVIFQPYYAFQVIWDMGTASASFVTWALMRDGRKKVEKAIHDGDINITD